MDISALIIFALSLTGYYILHSLLASEAIKQLLIPNLISKRYYRLVYNFLAIGLLLPLAWYYDQVQTTQLFTLAGLQYFGLLLAVLGFVFLLLALRQYNLAEFIGTQQWNDTQSPRHSLKTTGFNQYVRHPLYFSGLLLLWGWFLFKATDLFLVVTVISTIYLYVGTRFEERKLIAVFGEAYLRYQMQIPMLIPRLKNTKD